MKLQYHGDNKLHQFKQTWLEILNRMRQEDIPSEKALRDCLYNKIKDSPAMKWELGLHSENLSYDDPKRSYGNLLNIVDRTIMRRREQSNLTRHKLVYAKCWKGRTFSPFRPRQQHLLPMGNLTKGMESLTMQLPCSLRARPKLMLRQKQSPRKPRGANRQIPKLTKARNTFGVSSVSLIQVAEMVTSVRSVTPRRFRRHRLVQEHQVRPVARTTKCVYLQKDRIVFTGKLLIQA